MRPTDQPADPAADRRSRARDGRRHPVPSARAGYPRSQRGVRRSLRRPAIEGFRAGTRRRDGLPADRAAEAQEAGEAHEPRSFSFNAPYGACPECSGLGTKKEVDAELIIPDPEKSLRQGAIQPWSTGQSAEYFLRLLEALGKDQGFNLDTPWRAISDRAQKAILYGDDYQVHVRYRNRFG